MCIGLVLGNWRAAVLFLHWMLPGITTEVILCLGVIITKVEAVIGKD